MGDFPHGDYGVCYRALFDAARMAAGAGGAKRR